VEYATREQAQNAVNTLSNQNLMGRLVYVREVCYVTPFVKPWLTRFQRTVKPSPVSSVVLLVVISAPVVVASAVVSAVLPEMLAVKSMFQTFVLSFTPIPSRTLSESVNTFVASIQCWLARPEGSVPPSW
jgi:RNA recognition motif-containing protein